ncbi:hypothetical protein D3C87_1873540 [compost metagenome]
MEGVELQKRLETGHCRERPDDWYPIDESRHAGDDPGDARIDAREADATLLKPCHI